MLIEKLLKKKYPVVRQYDQIDCGPAALLSVLKYWRGDTNLVHVRELCQTNIQGSTMADIVRAARTLGFDAIGAQGKYEELIKEEMPCIAHVIIDDTKTHFVSLYKINEKGVLIGDPGKGLYKLKKEEFLKIWIKNVVVLLKPTENLYIQKTPGWFKWIFEYLKKEESWIYQSLFLGIIYTVIGLMTAVFVQWMIDKFIPEADNNKIIVTGLFLFVLFVVRGFTGYFRKRFMVILNKRVNINVNADFLSHIFHLPKKFFDTRKTGDITARLNDAMKIQRTMLTITGTTIIDILIILGSFIFMFQFSHLLAFISLFAVPIYGAILILNTRQIKSEQNEVMKSYAKVESIYIDSLKGIDEILGFNTSSSFANMNKLLFGHFQDKIEKLGFTQSRLSLFAELSGSIITICLLTIGALLVIKGSLLLGQMVAAYSLLANMLPSVNSLVGAHISLQGASIAATRLMDLLLVEKEKCRKAQPFKMGKSIKMENGLFAWPKSKPLFQDISFSIIKGKIVSLLGQSGVGKSTLVHLFQRKYDLKEGTLLVDNIPANRIDLYDYRKNIAVVPQTIKLFNGTLADNILVGRQITDIQQIHSAIDKLGLSWFLDRFDYGIFTILGEDSRKLSGGEQQILGLIRALFDEPAVLILDEGFNALDIEAERKIFQLLKNYSINHAVLIITHNLRTIIKTDYVYLMENGRIIQNGNPDILLQQDGYLKKIYELHQ